MLIARIGVCACFVIGARSSLAAAPEIFEFTNKGVEDISGLHCRSLADGFWSLDDTQSQFSLRVERYTTRDSDRAGYSFDIAGKPNDLAEQLPGSFRSGQSISVSQSQIWNFTPSLERGSGVFLGQTFKTENFEFKISALANRVTSTLGGAVPGYHFEFAVKPKGYSFSLVGQSVLASLSDEKTLAALPIYPKVSGKIKNRLGSYRDPRVECEFFSVSRINGKAP